MIKHQFCLKHCSQTNPVVLCLHALLQVGRCLSRMVGRKFHSDLRSSPFCQAMPGSFLWICRVCAARPEILDVRPKTSSSFWGFNTFLFRPCTCITWSMHINTEALLTPLVWWAFRKSLLRFKLFWCVAASVGLHGFKGEQTDSIRMPGPCNNWN